MFNGSLTELFNSFVYAFASGLNDEKVARYNPLSKSHVNQMQGRLGAGESLSCSLLHPSDLSAVSIDNAELTNKGF